MKRSTQQRRLKWNLRQKSSALRRELGIYAIGSQQSKKNRNIVYIVAHTSGSNLQLAAETCEFSRKFHRCPWDFNVHYPHFY